MDARLARFETKFWICRENFHSIPRLPPGEIEVTSFFHVTVFSLVSFLEDPCSDAFDGNTLVHGTISGHLMQERNGSGAVTFIWFPVIVLASRGSLVWYCESIYETLPPSLSEISTSSAVKTSKKFCLFYVWLRFFWRKFCMSIRKSE